MTFFKTEISLNEISDTKSSSDISKLFDILEILDSLYTSESILIVISDTFLSNANLIGIV